MATVQELQERISEIEASIASGELKVKHDGRFVEYRSLSEMKEILTDLKTQKNEIENPSSSNNPHKTLFNTRYVRGY